MVSGSRLLIGALLLLSRMFFSVPASAQTEGSAADDNQPSFMKMLAERGEHNFEDEKWNLYGQFTYISGWKPGFPARYTNANGSTNSLLPIRERSFTGTATLYAGVQPWKGAEIYVVPELLAERPLSQLKGLGGAIQDFELQKSGAETPELYLARAYIKQTFGFGGHRVTKESGQQQLGKTYDSRRLVVVAGKFSILDFLDKNAFDIDPRQGFYSMAFMTYAAYDFAADARGYAWGAVSELYWDAWALRFGHMTPPKNPNQLPVDFRLFKFFGDQIELEHDHQFHGRDGVVRLLGYRNRENIGRFEDAIAAFRANPQHNATTCTEFNYGSNNANAPDLCWARKPNVKTGIGIFGEQYLTRDIGVFSRAMISDGKTEVDAYTSTDRSLSLALFARGSAWSRPKDITGIGLGVGWTSRVHANYLQLGGIDGFVGDGHINPAAETALDAFYSFNYYRVFWISGDYQHIVNPAFNRDRGPVNVFSIKIHGEF
jgi:high affinity Mn2+ porin